VRLSAWLTSLRTALDRRPLERRSELRQYGAAGAAGAAERKRPFGATLFGYLRADCGIGEAARNLFFSLREVDCPVAAKCISRRFEENDHRIDSDLARRSPYGYHIFHFNAQETLHLSSLIGDEDIHDRYKIGVWAWELPRFPRELQPALDRVDEVWVPSRFVQDALRPVTTKPVLVFPHAVRIPKVSKQFGRAAFGLPDDAFIVLVIFDLHSHIARKNPEAAIAAFRAAFDNCTTNAHLVLKFHGVGFTKERGMLARAVADMKNTTILDCLMPREEVTGLQRCCDVFLSLHRSEGFGLNIAECMALEKCVIATNYSGNVDFFDASCGAPVQFKLINVRPGEYSFPADQHWAEPDIAEAAALLRRAYDDAQWRAALGRAGRERVERDLDYARVGAMAVERLRHLERQHPTPMLRRPTS
jgi:glycosyltransferase involved in cell wall biosynthesis